LCPESKIGCTHCFKNWFDDRMNEGDLNIIGIGSWSKMSITFIKVYCSLSIQNAFKKVVILRRMKDKNRILLKMSIFMNWSYSWIDGLQILNG